MLRSLVGSEMCIRDRGTSGITPHVEAFLGKQDHRNQPYGLPITPQLKHPPDLPRRQPTRLATENHLRSRLPTRVTPTLTYYRYAPNTKPAENPERQSTRITKVSTLRFSSNGVTPVREYQPVHPFDYACRPRLRTRLTRGRRTWPRNP